MPHSTAGRRSRQVETVRAQFAQAGGLPLADLRTADRPEGALRDEQATWHQAVRTPVLTPWAFLSQLDEAT